MVMDMTEIEKGLSEAVVEAARVFGSDAACFAGCYFSCGEADVIARLLAVAGCESDAATWLSGHAAGDGAANTGDDGGDRHWALGWAERAAGGPSGPGAPAYVAGLLGRVSSVHSLAAQLAGLDGDGRSQAREMYPRVVEVLDSVVAGHLPAERANSLLEGALGFVEAEERLEG